MTETKTDCEFLFPRLWLNTQQKRLWGGPFVSHDLRVQTIMLGESQQQENKAVGHIAPSQEAESGVAA